MSLNMSYLQADLARAEHQGARTIDINLLDLKELIRLANAAQFREEAEKATKHAAWIKPGALQALLSGRKSFVRISRRRSDECNTRLYYAANLAEKHQEYIAALEQTLVAAKEGTGNED